MEKSASIAWHNVALRNEAGQIIGTLSSGEDITDRKRAEEALRASEEKLATVFRFSPDAIGIARVADGVFLDVNDAFTEMLGYVTLRGHRKDLAGIASWPGNGWRLPVMAELFRVKEQVSDLELNFTARSGSAVTMLVSLIPITISGELCVLAIAHDITKRRRAEEALRQTQAELAAGHRATQRAGRAATSGP